jgi:hypothetical protein
MRSIDFFDKKLSISRKGSGIAVVARFHVS